MEERAGLDGRSETPTSFSEAEQNPVISVEHLRTQFSTHDGIVRAVDDVTFSIGVAETVGVVGESGCGKSMTALSLMNLVPRPHGRITDGVITFRRKDGRNVDIASLKPFERGMRDIRGSEMAMIFQEPMTSLNPVFSVGEQIAESIRLHEMLGQDKARKKAIEMLDRVNISNPGQRARQYPHQLSGGMRQRAMIAMAISCGPRFLIADEPTTALDVTIEAQILRLMRDLQKELGTSILFITHDLGVVAEMAERVLVMYTGKVVEEASTRDIFRNPKHPYTVGLLNSRPRIGRKTRLTPIEGSVPRLSQLPRGCPFEPRCPLSLDICREKEPPQFPLGNDHTAKCWLYERNGDPQ